MFNNNNYSLDGWIGEIRLYSDLKDDLLELILNYEKFDSYREKVLLRLLDKFIEELPDVSIIRYGECFEFETSNVKFLIDIKNKFIIDQICGKGDIPLRYFDLSICSIDILKRLGLCGIFRYGEVGGLVKEASPESILSHVGHIFKNNVKDDLPLLYLDNFLKFITMNRFLHKSELISLDFNLPGEDKRILTVYKQTLLEALMGENSSYDSLLDVFDNDLRFNNLVIKTDGVYYLVKDNKVFYLNLKLVSTEEYVLNYLVGVN